MVVKKRINLADFAGEIKNFEKKAYNQVILAAKIGTIKSIPEIVKKSPVDTGLYASSWDFTETETSIILGNFSPHAPIIENGARPFTPPLGPLLGWAKRVLQDSSQPPEYSPQVWRLAIGTRNKISREGMKPRHVLEKSIPLIIQNIKDEIDKI